MVILLDFFITVIKLFYFNHHKFKAEYQIIASYINIKQFKKSLPFHFTVKRIWGKLCPNEKIKKNPNGPNIYIYFLYAIYLYLSI